MPTATPFLDKKTIAELTARMYLDTGAVRFMTDKPFTFTSGWASPVYNDSRWLISFPDVRSAMMDFAVHTIERDIGRDKIDSVAGGETAGAIPTSSKPRCSAQDLRQSVSSRGDIFVQEFTISDA